jgi:hypothetical protein
MGLISLWGFRGLTIILTTDLHLALTQILTLNQ